ncbi:MAG: hypothetical protein GY821_06925 [Gammaproteobacteria bacterium]|nr:hypothetical protein [Gammaproteobacteria bacterium]
MFHYRSIVHTLKQQMASVLLPWRCLLCYQASDQARDLCRACQQQLSWLDQQRCCYYCAALLPVGADYHCCGRCLARAPYFDRTVVLWRYHGAVAMAVQRLKSSRVGPHGTDPLTPRYVRCRIPRFQTGV